MKIVKIGNVYVRKNWFRMHEEEILKTLCVLVAFGIIEMAKLIIMKLI